MLRQEIIDALNQIDFEELASDTAWVSQMKDMITYDEENEQLDITVPIHFEGLVKLDSGISQLADDEGNILFPFLTDQAGKFVKVNDDETGFEYGEVSGGTQLYMHTIKINSSTAFQTIVLITTFSTPLNEVSVPIQTFDIISAQLSTYGPGTNAINGFATTTQGYVGTSSNLSFGAVNSTTMASVSINLAQSSIETDTVVAL